MSPFSRFYFVLFATGLLLALGACDAFNGDDGSQPPSVAGFYDTSTLTVMTDTGAVDALARGTSIKMRIKPDNTVEDGVLVISSEFTEDDVQGSRRVTFAGTWSRVSDSTITFEHDADTFIRDTQWDVENDTLRANNGEVTAVLVRQEEGSS
ncbi:MAG: hypothetical protein ABEL04_09870 [Salinibacter sp.]|uniref:hypothetical protein n=1 Tax=Salinibacter sp. TaxID=2065818 RepID=UPI0035D4F10C